MSTNDLYSKWKGPTITPNYSKQFHCNLRHLNLQIEMVASRETWFAAPWRKSFFIIDNEIGTTGAKIKQLNGMRRGWTAIPKETGLTTPIRWSQQFKNGKRERWRSSSTSVIIGAHLPNSIICDIVFRNHIMCAPVCGSIVRRMVGFSWTQCCYLNI